MAWEDANPLFVSPLDEKYDKVKNYIAPIYSEEGARERLLNPMASDLFKKVTAVNQAGKIGLSYEGFSSVPYWDVDHYSIGYGTAAGDLKTISEPDARKSMENHLNTLHQTLQKNYAGYGASNPNVQGAVLDAAYTLPKMSLYPWISKFLKSKDTMPYAIQELPSFRKVKVTDPVTKEVKSVVRRGLEKRRADEFRLATTNEDEDYKPSYREAK